MPQLRHLAVLVALLLTACGTPGSDDTGDDDDGPSPQLKSLSAGMELTCAVLVDGSVKCWGRRDAGQLGDGVASGDGLATPVAVVGLTDATAVSAGVDYACALRAGGTVSCWGAGRSGLLGNGDDVDRLAPTEVTGLADVAEIATGYAATCARKTDGTVWCWGRGGSLGSSSVTSSSVPVAVAGLTDVAHLVNANEGGTSLGSLVCALRTDGTELCFASDNVDGQLGNGTQDAVRTPSPVLGTGDDTVITASLIHNCAVRPDGTYCWGASQLVGDATVERRLAPVKITSTRFVELDAGFEHTCGRADSGAVSCWGENTSGQVGDGIEIVVSDVRLVPTATLVTDAVLLSSGFNHSCAYTTAGKTLCWGANAHGQLGSGVIGSFERTATPAAVVW